MKTTTGIFNRDKTIKTFFIADNYGNVFDSFTFCDLDNLRKSRQYKSFLRKHKVADDFTYWITNETEESLPERIFINQQLELKHALTNINLENQLRKNDHPYNIKEIGVRILSATINALECIEFAVMDNSLEHPYPITVDNFFITYNDYTDLENHILFKYFKQSYRLPEKTKWAINIRQCEVDYNNEIDAKIKQRLDKLLT